MSITYRHAVLALAVAAAGTGTAQAQTVITREIAAPPAGTLYAEPPLPQPATTQIITRGPVTAAPERIVEPVETVETIRTVRPARTISRQVTTTTRRVATTTHVTTSKHATTARHVSRHHPLTTVRRSAQRLELTPQQQHTIYQVIRRERVVPAQMVTEQIVTRPAERVVTVPNYPPPAPAYVTPAYPPPPYTDAASDQRYEQWSDTSRDRWSDANRYETDGYDSDGYAVRPVPPSVVAAPPAVEVASPPVAVEQRIVSEPGAVVIGSRLPATVPLYAMPPVAIEQVPTVSGYRYAYLNDRVVVVDPATNIVLATLRQ